MALFLSHTPEFKDDKGKNIKDSIAEMKMINIGGAKQFVLIRGKNRNNPVLLLLHGGPGSPETILFRHYNSSLENKFVVVYWEQRGCGKSYSKEVCNKQWTLDMFVNDAIELVIYLRKYLNKKKLLLLAHSWGTFIGIMAAYRHPEYFYAYVGIGQVADMREGELKSYEFALKNAEKSHNKKAINELKKIGKPSNGTYKCGNSGIKIERKWLTYFGGSIYGKSSMNHLLKYILTANEYNILDVCHYIQGMKTPSRNELSQNQFLKVSLFEKVDTLKIPVFFFLGTHDYQVQSQLAEKYFNQLKAPQKTLIWFKNSAHCPCYEEADKFNSLLINNVLKVIQEDNS